MGQSGSRAPIENTSNIMRDILKESRNAKDEASKVHMRLMESLRIYLFKNNLLDSKCDMQKEANRVLSKVLDDDLRNLATELTSRDVLKILLDILLFEGILLSVPPNGTFLLCAIAFVQLLYLLVAFILEEPENRSPSQRMTQNGLSLLKNGHKEAEEPETQGRDDKQNEQSEPLACDTYCEGPSSMDTSAPFDAA